MARVYLKGLPELKRKLVALKVKTEAEIQPVMATAAGEVVAMMRRFVPVDEGDLRDSIGWTFGEAPKRTIKIGKFKQGSLTVTIYAGGEQAFYAHMVEFGTIKTSAQPFFWPSWRAMRKPIKRRIAKAIQDAVRNVSRT